MPGRQPGTARRPAVTGPPGRRPSHGPGAPVPRPGSRPALLGNRTPPIAVMMVMRMPRVIAVVAGCVLAAGCGPGAAVSGTANGTSAPGSPRPAASTAPAGSAGAAARCRKPASLPAGAAVQAWRLGAVRFVSPDTGLALTAPRIDCDVPLGDGRGTEVYVQAQPVRLATTSDAGRHWVTSGTELPATAISVTGAVAAVDGARTWVVSGTGKLLETGNAGATWAAQPLPAPVVAAASAGGWLWALSCPPVTGNWCRPDVERMKLPAGTWTVTRPGSPMSLLEPQLDVLSATAAVVVLQGTRPALASTTDGGARWTVRAAPAGPENMCHGDGDSRLFTAAGLRNWWLLCTGGAAAAGSSTKALMRSADAGQTWTVAASVTSLSAPARPGSLARQDAVAIAAGAPEVLWIATPNTVTESTDGGVTWSQSLVDPQGTFGQFDVQSSTHAWLLAPNAGLWHTTDGTTWHPVGGTAR